MECGVIVMNSTNRAAQKLYRPFWFGADVVLSADRACDRPAELIQLRFIAGQVYRRYGEIIIHQI
jgi:hypothetical protein